MTDPLPTWRDGATKDAILRYVEQTCTEGSPDFVPADERVAVFDNDGTLWCEKPMPIQLDFILRRLVAMAEADPALRDRQPWKAAYERDYGWLARVMDDHYAGDDTNLPCSPAASWRRSRTSASTSSRRSPPPSCATPVIPRWTAATSSAPTRPWSSSSTYLQGQRLRDLHRLRRRTRLHATDQRRGLRHPPGGRDRQRRRARVRTRRHGRGDHPPDGRGLPRRRAGEAGAHLEPHRTPAGAGSRQLQRRHRDARLHPAPRQAVPPAPRAARRRRARVRLRLRVRAGARTGGRAAAGRSCSIKDDWATVF